MEYEIKWKDKPRPMALKQDTRWHGKIVAGEPFASFGAESNTEQFAHYQDDVVFRGRLDPDTADDPGSTIRFDALEGCREVFVTARARIDRSDYPTTVKEKTYNVARGGWSLTSTDKRIVPYFNDDDLWRLRAIQTARSEELEEKEEDEEEEEFFEFESVHDDARRWALRRTLTR